MPFSIWVTKASTFREMRSCTTVLGRGRTADRDEVLGVLAPMRPRRRDADDSWVMHHPKTGEPWFRLRMFPSQGPLEQLELAASYSNPNFMRNALNMFDVGLMLAEPLGGNLFEESHGHRITRSTVDALLADEGPYAQELYGFFRQGRAELAGSLRAMLEVPLGAADEVGDYLAFAFRVEDPPTLDMLLGVAGEDRVFETHGVQGLVCRRDKGVPLVRIVRADDGVVVRPSWSTRPFAELATETLEHVARLEALLGVTPEYFGAPCDATERKELHAHAGGAGVDYYDWLVTTGRMTAVARAPATAEASTTLGRGTTAAIEREAPAQAPGAKVRSLCGFGLAAAWTTDASGARVALVRQAETDFRIEPASGLAVVARGIGAIGAQGRPGAILAVWSIVGEVRAALALGLGPGLALARGFARASVAVKRLTWSWRGARPPTTMVAAFIVDDDRAIILHAGALRVSRITASGLIAVTADHVLEPHGAVTRDLTDGQAPTVTMVPIEVGDEFLIAPLSVHRAVPESELAATCAVPAPDYARAMRVQEAVLRHTAEGSGAFAIVRITADRTEGVTLGGSMRPEPSWLFQPGVPLPDPPPGFDAQSGPEGPDPRWFATVADPLSKL